MKAIITILIISFSITAFSYTYTGSWTYSFINVEFTKDEAVALANRMAAEKIADELQESIELNNKEHHTSYVMDRENAISLARLIFRDPTVMEIFSKRQQEASTKGLLIGRTPPFESNNVSLVVWQSVKRGELTFEIMTCVAMRVMHSDMSAWHIYYHGHKNSF